MKKTTLETLLRDRLSDSRAMIGLLDINHDRVLLHFGAIGDLARVTLSIDDNEISIALPDTLATEWRLGDEAKRSRTPLDPAVPLKATLIEGVLRIGKDGPEVILLADDGETRLGVSLPGAEGDEGQTGEFVSFPAGETINAAFDGEKLTAGDGGPEIVLPETFYEYVAAAILTGEGDEDEPDADNGATGAETGADGETPAEPDQGANGVNGGHGPVDPEKHSRDALVGMAKAEGVGVGKDDTKRVIATKINDKRTAAAN